jgi:hypothetical protein
VVALASVPDKEFVLVLCRDTDVQQNGDFLQTLPVRAAAQDAFGAAICLS